MPTFPLTLPSLGFMRTRIAARSVTGVITSPFTLQQQIFEHQGERWEITCDLPPMVRAVAAPWVAALVSLRGQAGTFLLGPSGSAKTPRGIGTGTPLINGAGQTGKTVATDGWTANQTGILKAGDWISFGAVLEYLYMVMADANSNASGQATLEIFPRIRTATTDNDPITVSSPAGIFRLAEPLVEFDIDTAQHYGISFTAIEAI